ncbi:LamG-like jellyroll fold domain-containing protein [Microbacterium sp. 13-71-7]|uniref:LamG-like jellyroll fold domain-containing protein n=1 Tax=Microbacterium sp. 13-71-7 TaxID=1970399 RepID=UPI0025D25230|nr:LamG-like jellyroll fold domain-containing protein [Microbacterium sp. 13-71-7]
MPLPRRRLRRLALAALAGAAVVVSTLAATPAAVADPTPAPSSTAAPTPAPTPEPSSPSADPSPAPITTPAPAAPAPTAPTPTAPAARAAVPGAISPVAAYTFDADSGSIVKDVSGNGNDARWVGSPGYRPGVSGSAATIGLGTNYVKLPLVAGKTDGAASFSYEFWMSEQNRTSYGTLMSNQDFASCNNAGLTLYNQTTQGVLQACWGTTAGGTKRYLNGASPNIAGSWHHVAVTVDRTANVIIVYTDGVETKRSAAGEVTASTNLKSGFAFNIGGFSGSEKDVSDGYVNAAIDDLRFYDAVLPPAQVADDYTALKPDSGTYTVAFDGNGATSGAMAAQTFTIGTASTLAANGFVRPGYQFQGWALSAKGQVVYSDGQTAADLTVRANATVTLSAIWSRLRAPGDAVAPFASYDFETGDGAAIPDSSGRGNDATWSGSPSYVAGTAGKAAYVNAPEGSTRGVNFFSLPLVPGHTDGSGSFSYTFWLKEASSSSDSPIVSNQDFRHCYNRGATLYNTAGSPGILRGCFGQNGTSTTQNYLADASRTSVIGSWHHVAVVVDRSAGTMTTFVDGEQTAQSTSLGSGFSLVSGYPFRVGAEGSLLDDGDGFVNAAIDTFDFYDRAISAAQIQNDYMATHSGDVVTDGSTLARGFVSGVLRAPSVRAGGAVSQTVAGLWNGGSVTSYTKVEGDAWLTVDAQGVVTGTAPTTAPADPGYLTVEATDGTTTARIEVEVPVIAADAAAPFDAVTWNLWDAGGHVNDAALKNLAVIAENGFDVIGVQQDGGTAATALAKALGWNALEGPGGVGLISPYPLSARTVVGDQPGLGATADVLGRKVRVWTMGLDRTGYGPEAACLGGVTDPAALVAAERGSTRFAQVDALAAAIATETSAATPVVVLSDLESPSGSDWTAATSAAHCGVGAVDWPVPARLQQAGLADAYRTASPDPASDPGETWSPLVVKTPSGADEPQDRIDTVHYVGSSLRVLGANTVVAGWPSPTAVLRNAWASNHRAVVASFALGKGAPDPSSLPAVVASADGRTVTLHTVPAGSTGIEYRIDGGAWQPYAAPFAVPGSAASLVEYRATDQGVSGPISGLTLAATGADAGQDVQPLGTAKTVLRGEAITGLGAKVVDASGNGVSGADVVFTISGGVFPGGATTATVSSNAAGIAVAPSATAATAGTVTITAAFRDRTATLVPITVVEPASTLTADVKVTPAVVSGKVVLTVAVTNTGSAAADVKIATRYGTKTYQAVAPGATVSYGFSTMLAAIPAGTATVTLTNGSGMATIPTSYPAAR